MAVNRPQVGDSHILKPHAGYQELLDAVLRPEQGIHQIIAYHRNLRQSPRHILLQQVVAFVGPQIAEIPGNSSHILGYGHLIIVQDNDKILLQARRIIQCFIRHASGQCPVSDYGND